MIESKYLSTSHDQESKSNQHVDFLEWEPSTENRLLIEIRNRTFTVQHILENELPQLNKILNSWRSSIDKNLCRQKNQNVTDNLNNCKTVVNTIHDVIVDFFENDIAFQKDADSNQLLVCLNERAQIMTLCMYEIDPSIQVLQIHALGSSPASLMNRHDISLRGGGTAMIQALERLALCKQVNQIQADVLEEAIPFYKQMGFTQNSRAPIWQNGMITMEKSMMAELLSKAV